MRRRVLSSGFCTSSGFRACLAALALLIVSSVLAQQPTTISIPDRTAEISNLLREGRQLEAQRRWDEALGHYEDAIRLFPGEASLQQRFQFTRSHYNLGRRYADGSYCRALSTLPPERALELYNSTLLKIQAHYVEAPDWKDLIERGTDNFEVALSEPMFVDWNLPMRSRPAVDEFRRELRRTLGSRVIDSRDDARDAVAVAADLAQQRLKIAPAAVVLEYLCGATNTLDLYSTYLTPDQLSEVYSQIEGNFVGLGIELKASGGKLLVVRVISGSPAEQGGVRAGDCIVTVDGRSTRDLSTDAAADLLQGEAGSVVQLTVVTPGQPARQLSIRRRRVEVPSIDQARIIDPDHGIAYFRLACFQKTTCRDLDTVLWRLHRKGMKSLIIDLRGNPGGLLISAVDVSDKFLGHGIIVSTRGRSTREDFTYWAHSAGTWRVPLVVLIDQDSASAAEIFAGAIRDHRRGTIVGVRSFGKGSVQGIFTLNLDNAGVRLTTAKFYSPSGRAYSRIGVEPDVTVHLAARPIGSTVSLGNRGDDPMLSAALQAARRLESPR